MTAHTFFSLPTLTYAAPAVRTYYTYPGNDKLHFGRLGKGKEAGDDDDDDDATGGLKRRRRWEVDMAPK